ncbi:amidohydrolase family protein [Paenibacillus sp. LMG 31456]|uniref:Dihydroorotase n=1 Tax=Paenibacillus foliorum TaxID=2654974 RepID=A0A972GLF6_9BACL|nr:dihydroorotase [Paenibacillus foliorum]NOU92458.1 amidohydrolase family protein [Paenibacillus foliorum]
MRTLIKNGTVINPETHFMEITNVIIEDEKIVHIGPITNVTVDDHIIDASGLLVVPGLVDIHVHFRDPGFPQKETISSGALSAAAGGFTSVVCMPNTKPSIDTVETLEYVLRTGLEQAVVKVYSSAALTYGIEGKVLTEMESLKQAGAVTFTDDGRTVMDPKLVYTAFRKAAELDVPISSHCEDHHLVSGGSLNQGEVSNQLGDPGIPRLGEELIIARDILFAEETGAQLHIQHVSTARGVQLIREAKARGVRVTGEGAPHHFSITDEQALLCGTLAKVNPPLRTKEDVEAVIAGLADGTLEAIATDHAPHTAEEKARPLGEAPFGLVGLETAVGLTFTFLVHSGRLSLMDALAKLTVNPSEIMGLPSGRLTKGSDADITILDPQKEWTVDPEQFKSQSRNSPFAGMKLKGKAVLTMVNGTVVYDEMLN